MGKPAQQGGVLNKSAFLRVFGQIDPHGPSTVFRQAAAGPPERSRSSANNSLMVSAETPAPLSIAARKTWTRNFEMVVFPLPGAPVR